MAKVKEAEKLKEKTDSEFIVDKETDRVNKERSVLKEKMLEFTGEVLTFIYRPHLGFADYAIVRLKMDKGKVLECTEVSDPYAAFEARAHMETKQAYQLEVMRRSYPGGFRHV